MLMDFLVFTGVTVQICVLSFTFSVTDHKHVLFICYDIFSSMFLILNNIWKIKMKSSSLDISKHASRITLIVPNHHYITKKRWSICKFLVFSLIVKIYWTCELKSEIIGYRRYSVKNCAFYLASATTLFLLDFNKMWASWNLTCL